MRFVARLIANHPQVNRQGLRQVLAETSKPTAAGGPPLLNYTAALTRIKAGA